MLRTCTLAVIIDISYISGASRHHASIRKRVFIVQFNKTNPFYERVTRPETACLGVGRGRWEPCWASPPVLLGLVEAHRAAGGNTARVWGCGGTSVGPYIVLCKRPQNARSHGHPWSRTSVLGWFPGPHGSNRWATAPGLNRRCGSFPGSRPARAILVGRGRTAPGQPPEGGRLSRADSVPRGNWLVI